jgi:hypothetical protein
MQPWRAGHGCLCIEALSAAMSIWARRGDGAQRTCDQDRLAAAMRWATGHSLQPICEVIHMNEFPNVEGVSSHLLVYVFLHGRYAVLIELLNCVRHQLDGVAQHLAGGETYKARQLCGDAFWGLLTRDEKRLVGSCISHLAGARELPLVKVNEFRSYPNKYQLLEIH